jgi:hypothetical protein
LAKAAIRSALIEKGMILSRALGDTDLTLRLFDAVMRRIMPDP